MVEIARALGVRSRVLILDEPTSSLSEAETTALFSALRRLRSKAWASSTSRIGSRKCAGSPIGSPCFAMVRTSAPRPSAELDPRTLVRWMVGRDIKDHFPRPPWNPGATALEVRRLCNARVHDVSFTLRRGEILGFAGLVGAGRSELARALSGIDPIASGEILVEGQARDDRVAGQGACSRNRLGARGSAAAGTGDDRLGRL